MHTRDSEVRTAFLSAAIWHGALDEAERILAGHPELSSSDIHTAAVLGDDVAVRRFLESDPSSVNAKAPPYGGDALNYLCLSKYLRLDKTRNDAFVRAASALLDAGADPNTGFWNEGEFETAGYGAAGVAHHADMTRLLLERGADPNDVEVVYHSPESDDNAAMALVVETGRVTPDNLALMLVRKADWHDFEGIKYLLAHGADPNRQRENTDGNTPMQHAVIRDNDLEHIAAMLDHGGDPTLVVRGQSTVQIAARRGRGDLLGLFRERGFSSELRGVERLVAACAVHDEEAVRAIAGNEPQLVQELMKEGGTLLAQFAGTWNTKGVGLLLDLGVPVDATHDGDGYYGTPKNSTALHVAAWRGVASTVKLLIERGANVNARDGEGNTPIVLAVKAAVDSYWTGRRSSEAVKALLGAGASADGVTYPSGYDEMDELLRPLF